MQNLMMNQLINYTSQYLQNTPLYKKSTSERERERERSNNHIFNGYVLNHNYGNHLNYIHTKAKQMQLAHVLGQEILFPGPEMTYCTAIRH